MKSARSYRLGDLQLRIMKVLWERGEASVAEVHDALGADAGLAYTTVATMLRKMETRGLVTHASEGRRFVYRAAIAPDVVTRSMANDVLERLFEGRLADMLDHLLSTREVSRDELRALERLIRERKKQS
ncbi:MAG TPA: BlaI/MecI/CopY family transcriptional regulator [Gemmataceae bacterium]|nr:BlaI/MecI/CopY family transcriptional regulator [Gemmataceae bacterium]